MIETIAASRCPRCATLVAPPATYCPHHPVAMTPMTLSGVGEVITYAITVRNMGNVSLTGVVVTDPFVSDLARGADIVGNNDNVLNVGEIWSYTAHHAVTQADINSGGFIVNTATADSDQTGPDSATVSTTVERDSEIELVMQQDVASVDAAGDVITW